MTTELYLKEILSELKTLNNQISEMKKENTEIYNILYHIAILADKINDNTNKIELKLW